MPDANHVSGSTASLPSRISKYRRGPLNEPVSPTVPIVSPAVTTRPACQHLVVMTNANDVAVSNQLTRQLVSLWQSRGLRRVEFYEFDRDQRLEHDLIDPNNPRQRIALVYPILLDMILNDPEVGAAPLALPDDASSCC